MVVIGGVQMMKREVGSLLGDRLKAAVVGGEGTYMGVAMTVAEGTPKPLARVLRAVTRAYTCTPGVREVRACV